MTPEEKQQHLEEKAAVDCERQNWKFAFWLLFYVVAALSLVALFGGGGCLKTASGL